MDLNTAPYSSHQQKAIELDNYKFFDFNIIGVDGVFDDLVAYIYEKISSTHSIGRIKQAKKHLEVILCNVYWVHELDDKKYIAYSRGKNRYLKTSRYNKTGITYNFVKVIDALPSIDPKFKSPDQFAPVVVNVSCFVVVEPVLSVIV